MSSPYPSSPLWPVEWSGATFTGKLITINADPSRARILIRPNVTTALTHLTAKTVVEAEWTPIPTSGSTGAFTVGIPATDDAATRPTDWKYLCRIDFGRTLRPVEFEFEAPAGAVVDLASIFPTAVVPNGQAPLAYEWLRSALTAGSGVQLTPQPDTQKIVVTATGGGSGGTGGGITVAPDPTNPDVLIITPGGTQNAAIDPGNPDIILFT